MNRYGVWAIVLSVSALAVLQLAVFDTMKHATELNSLQIKTTQWIAINTAKRVSVIERAYGVRRHGH